ncbi:MAG: sigma-54-dependent transcriptional regulator [Hyphomonadaceae bacterium]|jgi:two-component system nitrogen regulation response regulator NtrX|uniref:nitrogen assimilation response regulator NtrX n=1 Tax=Aquidulcibacter sp. TaxID=2052990 RepID=UPI0022C14B42|nr:sigma-54 dependent transcriptional regulator [Aquidulcibacter sp.]MCZ8209994.1 sigma-54 dependent transcriptional regulator [Aquidulcibacter sp.]
MAAEILIVDDEADIRDLVGGILEDEGYVVRYAADSDGALDAFRTRRPDLVVLDVWLQGSRLDGLEILSVVQGIDPTIPIVLISGHGTIETAVSALKRGAFDFIEKPFKSDRLILIISRALESARLRRENMALRARAVAGDELIGESTVMLQLRAAIEKIAPMNSRVLITGPSGSGKEVIARALHAGSQRADGPFVVISAAAIAPERMESELFGEETSEGRPTKIGVFEHAHNGTLLLDEIAEMPMETQSKILRVLVEQRFRRLGGSSDVSVNVRVISSTARDLRDAISIGRFREDLFHRLNVVPIRSPALAERRDDVPRLVEHFSKRVAEANGVAQRQFGPEALAAMQAASWPGNVRELRNLVERMLILASGDASEPIDAAALALDGVGVGELADRTGLHQLVSLPLREARELFEREYLAAQITRFGGNISRTASFIGMERSALHRKLKSLGVEGTRGFDLEG